MKTSLVNEPKLGTNMPCHINYGSECCGIFNKIDNGTVVCNECGVGVIDIIGKALQPKKDRNFITQTLLVKCPDCKKFIDLGSKSVEVYNTAFAFMLNKKCPYCETLISESDTNESDYRIVSFSDC